jgi:hypothetical protein
VALAQVLVEFDAVATHDDSYDVRLR